MPNNCVGPTIPVTGCCQGCNSQLQENCPCQACSPVSVQYTADINNAVCVPILAEQIYDCVTIEKEQCSYLTGVTFNITPAKNTAGATITYSNTAPICITGVGLTYDFIGLVAGSTGASGTTGITGVDPVTSIIVDGVTQTITPTNIRICEDKPGADRTHKVGLFNQASATISRKGCCCNPLPGQTSSRARVIERGLTFWVCGLNLSISGVIGCDPFTATTSITPGVDMDNETMKNPIPLTDAPEGFEDHNRNLGFDPITFCGRVCMPISEGNVKLNETFDTCLQADCVSTETNTVSGTAGSQTLKANVELTFAVTKQIIATLQQQMAVFTTPDAVICTSSPITPCGNVTQQ